jgi:hypothetical protein
VKGPIPVLLGALIALAAPARADGRPEAPVLLVGPPEARLLVQLRRELAASGFAVIERAAVAPVPPEVGAVVVVDGDAQVRVLVPGGPGQAPRLRADLAVDRTDPHARRRACLAVVEYLRFGAPAEGPPPARAAPAPAPPVAPLADAAVELDALGPPRRSWGLGAATTLNVDSGIGEPTSHAQLMAQVPLSERWAITLTGLWPLLGAQFQTEDQYVRMWTLGAAGGVRLALPRPLARVRPFVGLELGARFVLAEAESVETLQSRVTVTSGLSAGASAGLLIQLRPRVHLLLEGRVERLARLPLGARRRYEAQAASGRAAHAALGVLFEY